MILNSQRTKSNPNQTIILTAKKKKKIQHTAILTYSISETNTPISINPRNTGQVAVAIVSIS